MSKKEDKSIAAQYTPLHLILHCLAGISICLIMSFSAALLISAEKLPYSSIRTISFFAIASGVFAAGFLTSKKFGKPLISSAIQSFLSIIITYLIGVIIHARFIPPENIFFNLSGCLCGLVLSTITAILTKSSPRQHRTFKSAKR